jgi:hypothetical protein
VSGYSAEDEFYGRVAFEASTENGLSWDEVIAKGFWVDAAKAARAAKYEDPIEALNLLLQLPNLEGFHRLNVGALRDIARRAYELGARAPKDGAK